MSVKNGKARKTRLAGLLLLLAAAVWIVIRLNAGGSADADGSTNELRVQYIQSFGWETSTVPISVNEVRVPAEFDEAYKQYNAIQKEQGFDLRRYRACYAKKYTYRLKKYDGADPAVPICANLLVVDGKIVAADISSSEAKGFVTVLAKKE